MTIIGIDLGTSNSCAAVWVEGKPKIIPNSEGFSLTPSAVVFDNEQQEWVVGQKARELAKLNPLMSVYSIKRFMGRRFGDVIVQNALHKLHILYQVEESAKKKNDINVTLGDFHLTPPEVSAKGVTVAASCRLFPWKVSSMFRTTVPRIADLFRSARIASQAGAGTTSSSLTSPKISPACSI